LISSGKGMRSAAWPRKPIRSGCVHLFGRLASALVHQPCQASAEALIALAAEWQAQFGADYPTAMAWAAQQGSDDARVELPDGTIKALALVRDGRPWFVTTGNVNAADSV